MPAKKKTAKRKATAKKKTATKRGSAKRAPAKARKKAAAKPKSAKPAAAKKAAPVAKPVAAAPRPAAPAPRPAPKPQPASPPAPTGEGRFSAHDVNRGHIFSLRPRANTGFSPEAFDEARRELAEERYATIEDAARAVAERALELTQSRPPRAPFPGS
jgi:hypothetical protein